jgi:hypothetical protein
MIQDCEDGFQMVNQEICVDTNKFSNLSLQMANYALELSASVNGYNMCRGQDIFLSGYKAYFRDLKLNLNNEFRHEASFQESIDQLKLLLQEHFFFRLEFLKNDYYLISSRVNLSSWCQFKIIFRNYFYELGVAFLLLGCLIGLFVVKTQMNKSLRISDKIYYKLLNQLRINHKVNINRFPLIRKFKRN